MRHTLTLALAALLLVGGARLSAQEKIDPTPPVGAPGLPGQPPGVGGIGGPPGGLPGFGPTTDHKELVAALIDNLDDADAEVRQAVAMALGKVGRQAVSPLVGVLKDKDKSASLRANAAYALGQIGSSAQEALPELTKALKEKDKELRKRAAYAIGNIVQGGHGFGFGGLPVPVPFGPGGAPGGGGLKPLDPGAVPPAVIPPPDKKPPEKN